MRLNRPPALQLCTVLHFSSKVFSKGWRVLTILSFWRINLNYLATVTRTFLSGLTFRKPNWVVKFENNKFIYDVNFECSKTYELPVMSRVPTFWLWGSHVDTIIVSVYEHGFFYKKFEIRNFFVQFVYQNSVVVLECLLPDLKRSIFSEKKKCKWNLSVCLFRDELSYNLTTLQIVCLFVTEEFLNRIGPILMKLCRLVSN